MNNKIVCITVIGGLLILVVLGHLFLKERRQQAAIVQKELNDKKWKTFHKEAKIKIQKDLDPIVGDILAGIPSKDFSALDKNWIQPNEYDEIGYTESRNKEKHSIRKKLEFLSQHINDTNPIAKRKVIGPLWQTGNLEKCGKYLAAHTENKINHKTIPYDCINQKVGYGYWIYDTTDNTHEIAFLFFRIGNNWRIVEEGPH